MPTQTQQSGNGKGSSKVAFEPLPAIFLAGKSLDKQAQRELRATINELTRVPRRCFKLAEDTLRQYTRENSLDDELNRVCLMCVTNFLTHVTGGLNSFVVPGFYLTHNERANWQMRVAGFFREALINQDLATDD